MKTELTDRQGEVLDCVVRYIATNGIPPTHSEVADIMGLAHQNAATDHLKALERKGRIKILPGKARGIVVL